MTKEKAPLTFEDGLARISGKLAGGMAELAQLAGRQSSTCYEWMNPDKADLSVPVHIAVNLDIAYLEAGGGTPPLFAAYEHQLGRVAEQRLACRIELARRAVDVIREGGEAHAAIMAATLPDATPESRRTARSELGQALQAIQDILPLLDDRPAPDTS